MSSDKNLIPKYVSKNNDSFDDRICDDLSEVLLQFLPLEDKIRLECVSKQFQRTVFRKQFTITLYVYSSFELNKEKCEEIEDNETVDLKSIESLLKKCSNIQRMNLFVENNNIFESIVPLITKYCDHLNEFNVSLDDRSEPELNEEFYRKFGSKLNYISCGQNLDFNLFRNLYSIHKTDCHLIPTERVVGFNLKNLKELNIDLLPQNENLFREVLQKFHKIKHLSLRLYNDNEESVFNAFKESAVLQNLIELKYDTINAENENQFLDSLTQLAKKFPKLKSIAFVLVLMEDISNISIYSNNLSI